LERSIRRVSHDDKEQRLTIRVHPEVALYLMEEEPKFMRHLQRTAGLDIDLRDDPIISMDEFRLVSQPAGRDVTERYAVA
jgi:ribonuclease G